jgi:hypothetical protein
MRVSDKSLIRTFVIECSFVFDFDYKTIFNNLKNNS